jgi:hypothetical protein
MQYTPSQFVSLSAIFNITLSKFLSPKWSSGFLHFAAIYPSHEWFYESNWGSMLAESEIMLWFQARRWGQW